MGEEPGKLKSMEVDTEMVAQLSGFDLVDTDRARVSAELKEMNLNAKESAEIVSNMSVHVSEKLLNSLGLEEYMDIFEKKRIGISELRGLDSDGLKEIGIKNVLHRAKIVEAAKEDIRSDPPKLQEDKPVEVRVKCGFGRLADISTVHGSCNIKLFVDLYWNDPRLIGVLPEKLPTSFMWYPDAYFYNSIDRTGEGGGHINSHAIVLMNPKTGLILRPMEIEIKCSVNLNLRKFPFDENKLVFLLLQSEHQTSKDYVFASAKDPKSCIKFFYDTFETPEFDLTGYSMDFYTGVGGNGVRYADFELHVHIRRRPLFYMWNTVIPLFLTTTFAFTTFFFEIKDLEARSTTAQTTLLTTVALLYVLAQELPKTNYLTRIDKYLLFCLFTQLSVWALSCSYTFGDDDIIETLEFADKIAAGVIPSLFAFVTIMAFAPSLFLWSGKTFETKPKYSLKGREGFKLAYYPLVKGRNVFA